MLAIFNRTSPQRVPTVIHFRASAWRCSSRRRTPKRARLGENNLSQPGRVSRLRKHREQHSRTVFLHLHRHGKNIERAFFEQAINYVSEYLRIQIVEIGLKHRDYFLRNIRGDFRLRFADG